MSQSSFNEGSSYRSVNYAKGATMLNKMLFNDVQSATSFDCTELGDIEFDVHEKHTPIF